LKRLLLEIHLLWSKRHTFERHVTRPHHS